jgi:uncharacterized protein
LNYRKGDWCQTFTGIAFWPMDPHPDEVDIRDIAHALSMQCRYGGHARYFYSVAEHCVSLSNLVPAEFAREALMHDAAEAYLTDVPRPVKAHLIGYKEAEQAVERVVASKYGLTYPWPDIVMEYDTRILTDERKELMATPPLPWGSDAQPIGARIFGFSPEAAETRFMRRFRELFP